MDNNHRQEIRIAHAETIFIEVQSSYANNLGEGSSRLLICNSVDVSANGIQAQIDEPLPVGAIYQLCIEIAEPAERLFLAAQVKWIRKTDDGQAYHVGLMIFESDDTDIEGWKRHIARQLSNE